MKLLYIGQGSSIHNVRWLNSISENGVEITFLTIHAPREKLDKSIEVVKVPGSGWLGYVLVGFLSWVLSRRTQFDIRHIHYATGYGMSAFFGSRANTILSVWGSDVYEFPRRSSIHRWYLRKVLERAELICSTSEAMKHQVECLFRPSAPIRVTPFGIDTSKFKTALLVDEGMRVEGARNFVVGTVKTLEPKYGIDVLIRAFCIFKQDIERLGIGRKIELHIAGEGYQENDLRRLVNKLGLEDCVKFLGFLRHDDVPKVLNSFDVFAALSREESFGVAAIEASACGLPVVVSNIGGLPEVVRHGTTGFVVAVEQPEGAAEVFRTLFTDPVMRRKVGETGQKHVAKTYSWSASVQIMLSIYSQIADPGRKD